ncbi:unnamed protein product [Mesocestoides corti]|uniref:PDEase domain-containing protein n=2 Tax=Mesocestoides corti TaxID=53468 RepID=A0A0R3UDN6_MESCO|nr:unnamed protein product [Mesocestoides corti]
MRFGQVGVVVLARGDTCREWGLPSQAGLLSNQQCGTNRRRSAKHIAPVAMYASIHRADLARLFDHLDLFTLLFSAICHDLDHPGLTNTYQVSCCLFSIHYTSGREL